MDRKDPETIVLLRRAADGDVEARNEAWSRVHEEALRVASAQRRRWSGDWTLETRVLASEVFIKLFAGQGLDVSDRSHFFTLLARAVRQILVNYGEAKRAGKRGAGAVHVELDEGLAEAFGGLDHEGVLDLHNALERFEELDPRAAKVVELRFFAGLSYDEVAETLDIGKNTAVRDWKAARAWLHHALDADLSPARDDTDD